MNTLEYIGVFHTYVTLSRHGLCSYVACSCGLDNFLMGELLERPTKFVEHTRDSKKGRKGGVAE